MKCSSCHQVVDFLRCAVCAERRALIEWWLRWKRGDSFDNEAVEEETLA